MIRIEDFDTGFKIGAKTIGKIKKMSGILTNQLNRVPIFLVNEQTMDELCHSKCLDRGSVEDFLLDYRRSLNTREREFSKINQIRDIMKKLDNSFIECKCAVGCYIPEPDLVCNIPHVLICPQRLKSKNRIQQEDLLIEVILHELTHAFFSSAENTMDVSKHIIEESLCEAYSFYKFENPENIFDFVTNPNMPPEYTSFAFWIEMSRNLPLIMVMNHWREKNYKSIVYSVFSYSRLLYHDLLYEGLSFDESLAEVAFLLLLFS
jgi:hypothetical protein